MRQSARNNARQSILVADRSKFGRLAPAVGGHLAEADMVVTEARPGASFATLLDQLGDRLVVTGEET